LEDFGPWFGGRKAHFGFQRIIKQPFLTSKLTFPYYSGFWKQDLAQEGFLNFLKLKEIKVNPLNFFPSKLW